MSTPHTTRLTISLEFSEETGVFVEYNYSPGIPEVPQTSGDPGLPAEPIEIDITRVVLDLPANEVPFQTNLLEFLTEETLADLRCAIEESFSYDSEEL